MEKTQKIMIIKLSNNKQHIPLTNSEKLKERISGSWVTTLTALNSTHYIAAMYQGEIIATYEMGDKFQIERVEGKSKTGRSKSPRIKFLSLKETDLGLIGRVFEYKTKNPLSLITYEDLLKLEIKS